MGKASKVWPDWNQRIEFRPWHRHVQQAGGRSRLGCDPRQGGGSGRQFHGDDILLLCEMRRKSSENCLFSPRLTWMNSVLHYTRRARRGGGNWCPIFYSAEARRTRSQFIGDWRVTGNGLPSSLKRGRTKGTNRSPSGRFKGRSIFDPAIGSAGVPPANTVLLVLAQRGVTGANLCPQGELWPLWGYEREGWARRFFENWRASLKWQRLKPYEKFAEMIDRGFGHSIALRTFDRRRSSFETDVTSEAAGVAGDVAAERFAR